MIIDCPEYYYIKCIETIQTRPPYSSTRHGRRPNKSLRVGIQQKNSLKLRHRCLKSKIPSIKEEVIFYKLNGVRANVSIETILS